MAIAIHLSFHDEIRIAQLPTKQGKSTGRTLVSPVSFQDHPDMYRVFNLVSVIVEVREISAHIYKLRLIVLFYKKSCVFTQTYTNN